MTTETTTPADTTVPAEPAGVTGSTEGRTRAPARAEVTLPPARARGVPFSIMIGLIIAALGIGFALGCLVAG